VNIFVVRSPFYLVHLVLKNITKPSRTDCMRNSRPGLTGAKITTWTQAEFSNCTRNSSSGRKSSDFLMQRESSATISRITWASTRVWQILWSSVVGLQALALRMTGLQKRTLFRLNPQNRRSPFLPSHPLAVPSPTPLEFHEFYEFHMATATTSKLPFTKFIRRT